MAVDIKAASVYASVGYRIDKKSWKELDRFSARLEKLKRQYRDLASTMGRESRKVEQAMKRQGGLEDKILKEQAKQDKALARRAAARGRRASNITSKRVTFDQRVEASGLDKNTIREYVKEFRELSLQYRRNSISASRYNARVKELSARMKSESVNVNKLKLSYGGLRRMMINLTAAYSAFATISQISNVGKQFEGAGTLFEGVFKGEAASEMSFLREESNRLGVSLLDSTNSYAKLSFAAKKSGASIEDIKEIYSSFTEASVVMGNSQEDTEGIFRALIQMYSKGNVQAEELRGQLGDRLPAAFEMAAESMGMTTEAFDKAVTNRLIKANELVPKLAKRIRQEVAETLPKALGLLARRERRLLNEFEQFQNSIFRGGLGQTLGFTYDSLAEILEGLTPIAEFFTKILTPAVTVVVSAFRILGAVLHDVQVLFAKIQDSTGISLGLEGLMKIHPAMLAIQAARGGGSVQTKATGVDLTKVEVTVSPEFDAMFKAKVVKGVNEVVTEQLDIGTGD